MKYLEDLYITGRDREMVNLGLGEIKANKLNLSEGKRNKEIVEAISKICLMGQYPTNDTNRRNYEVWFWSNPNGGHCTLTFHNSLSNERINEIIQQMINICGKTGPQTWIDYHVVYNDAKLNQIAKNFIKDMDGKTVLYNGKNCRVLPYGTYNNNCVASFVMPVRNRKNGYWLNNLETVRLAIEVGYLNR